MLNKILDPLKLFFIGAIVAALIVLGFQLGKETDKGLLEYLRQDNATLQAELEKLRRETAGPGRAALEIGDGIALGDID